MILCIIPAGRLKVAYMFGQSMIAIQKPGDAKLCGYDVHGAASCLIRGGTQGRMQDFGEGGVRHE